MSLPQGVRLTVHHLNNSRSTRILWLLNELSIPFELKQYKRDITEFTAPKELEKAHPLGHAPVLTIEQEGQPTISLAESGAIVEYVVRRFGTAMDIQPSDPRYAKYVYYMHAAEGSIMATLGIGILCFLVPKKAPWIVRPIASLIFSQIYSMRVEPQVQAFCELLEADLKANGGNYIVGDKLSGADIQVSFPIQGVLTSAPAGAFPYLRSWLEKLEARPAYKKAEEQGGKVDLSAFRG